MSPVTPEKGESDLPDELARLPHGRHGLPAEFVERNQRERLIASFTALIGEVGYSQITIETINEGAGVSSRTFYKYFDTVEETYVAAFERAIEHLAPVVFEAFASQSKWSKRIRAVLDAVLTEFTEVPDLARLLCAEPFVAGPKIAARHKAVIEQLAPYLREGRGERKGGGELPETTEKGLLGGASSMIGRQAFAAEDGDFTALLPDLLQFLLTPYLGPAKAHKLAVASK